MSDVDEMHTVYMSGHGDGAKEMRERAAKLVEDFIPSITSPTAAGSRRQLRDQAAAAIRALPIDAAQEPSDG